MRLAFQLALLSIAPAVLAQEKSAPGGLSPALWLASAAERNGKVVVQLARPGPAPPADAADKPAQGQVWVYLRPVTLGETVHAFGIEGQRLDAKPGLTALAKSKGAAVFVRSYRTDPTVPPEFYRALIREGTVLLVVNAEDLYNPKP
jgi:hypothetical protein